MRAFAWYGSPYYPPEPEPPPPPRDPDDPREKPDGQELPDDGPMIFGRGRGLVLGRFLPPHRGHALLLDFARRYADHVDVLVCGGARDPIPLETRVGWMRELFPLCAVRGVAAAAGEDWDAWRAVVAEHVPAPPRWLFASEPAAGKLAALLGAELVLVDPRRDAVPISGTRIREAPLEHWDFLPPPVRAHYARRVAIVGPESTGKSTLARRLAARLGTVCVDERARGVARLTAENLPRLARAQVAAEEALARQCDRVLLCDTDLQQLVHWAERLLGSAPAWLADEARGRRYDLALVTAPDVRFEGDPARDDPAAREAFFEETLRGLFGRGIRHVVLRGSFEERIARATREVEELR